MIMDDFNVMFYVCAGSWCFAPVVLFVLGFEIGSGKIKLPFRIVRDSPGDDTFSSEIE